MRFRLTLGVSALQILFHITLMSYQRKGCSRSGSAGCRGAPAGGQPPGSAPPPPGGAGPRDSGWQKGHTLTDAPDHHHLMPASASARFFPTAESKTMSEQVCKSFHCASQCDQFACEPYCTDLRQLTPDYLRLKTHLFSSGL